MAKYMELSPCLIGHSCVIKTTQGGHQKNKQGVIVDETLTLLKIRVDDECYNWKFSKKDMLRTEVEKTEFPCYMLELDE